MIPTGFDGETHLLDKPDAMERDQCEPLSVQAGVLDGILVMQSCWKLTAEEIEEVNRTGRIWLGLCTNLHPAVILSGHRLPLEPIP